MKILINNNMKICVIYHNQDIDGWMSAAIVKHWFIETNKPNNYIIDGIETARGGNPYSPNTLDFIGYNYGQPIPDLLEYDKVIMVDISFPNRIMKDLHLRLRNKLIWIDHHISAIKEIQDEEHNICLFDGKDYIFNNLKLQPKEARIKGFRNTKFAACELTWFYYFSNKEMPEIVRLLGRYDCFGHKGTDEEQKVLEFQYGARMIISNYKQAHDFLIANINYGDSICESIHIDGAAIYRYLCAEAKQIYKNGFEITFYKGKENSIPEYWRFICINKERFNPINFGIDYHKDGYDGCACFYLNKDKKWCFSLYSDNGEIDCSMIAKQFGGGGHFSASGFILDSEQFNIFMNERTK